MEQWNLRYHTVATTTFHQPCRQFGTERHFCTHFITAQASSISQANNMSLFKTMCVGFVFISICALSMKAEFFTSKDSGGNNRNHWEDVIVASPIANENDGDTVGRDLDVLNTTVCSDRCSGDCIHFFTPIETCYNGQNMFDKKDNPFGEQDILDQTIMGSDGLPKGIKREFFSSTDGSCSGNITDSFDDIPIGKCVGPYGPPRPWGILKIEKSSYRDFTFSTE